MLTPVNDPSFYLQDYFWKEAKEMRREQVKKKDTELKENFRFTVKLHY